MTLKRRFGLTGSVLGLVLLFAGCGAGAEDAPASELAQPPLSAALEGPSAADVDSDEQFDIGEFGGFQARATGVLNTTLRGHATFDESLVLHLYAVNNGTADVIRLAWRPDPVDGKNEIPTPGTYPVYSQWANKPSPATERNAGAFFTSNFVRQSGPMPSIYDFMEPESKPIGSVTVIEGGSDRIKGQFEFDHPVMAPDQSQPNPLHLEGRFDAKRDPKLEHYRRHAVTVMEG